MRLDHLLSKETHASEERAKKSRSEGSKEKRSEKDMLFDFEGVRKQTFKIGKKPGV